MNLSRAAVKEARRKAVRQQSKTNFKIIRGQKVTSAEKPHHGSWQGPSRSYSRSQGDASFLPTGRVLPKAKNLETETQEAEPWRLCIQANSGTQNAKWFCVRADSRAKDVKGGRNLQQARLDQAHVSQVDNVSGPKWLPWLAIPPNRDEDGTEAAVKWITTGPERAARRCTSMFDSLANGSKGCLM
ncbi:hypothetical protein MRS44_002530 [Fusarium solani]|uniref:uncharacterized protein n=1 Tax=Fusarium solani TaxID=169388 RepID=UPI0032C4106C|nr:hypothetical protein MRS44_002530 [Fusarium solani]